MEIPTHLRREIADTAMDLIKENWSGEVPIRLITVGCSDLVPEGDYGQQLSFFDNDSLKDREKQERLESAMDSIRKKLGRDSISLGFGNRPGGRISSKDKE